MSNITYIYNIQNQKDIKLLDSLNYTLEEFKSNPLGCYPNWNEQTMYATNTKFNKPILVENTVREMTREEICKSGDLSILSSGEVYQEETDTIIHIPIPDGFLKPKWVYPEWVEEATQDEKDLNDIETMYKEYEPLDKPSFIEEMKLQNPNLAEELISMLIQLRGMSQEIINKQKTGITSFKKLITLPNPSKELIEFKNKFKI